MTAKKSGEFAEGQSVGTDSGSSDSSIDSEFLIFK